MERGLALIWVLAGACSFGAPGAPGTDAAGDGDGSGGCTTFSAQLDTCELPSPFPLMLSGMLTFDTNTGMLRDAANIEIPVVSWPVMTRGTEVRALVASTVEILP